MLHDEKSPSDCESSPAELFAKHLDVIDRAAAFVAHKMQLAPHDAEDFSSDLKLKLIADDYSVLRAYRGHPSHLPGFLRSVVTNFGHDWRNAQWGKWRPSAEAERQGPLAVEFERLTHREAWSTPEARALLRQQFGGQVSDEAIDQIGSTLPKRKSRRSFVGLESITEQADSKATAEERSLRSERQVQAQAWRDALRQALGTLDGEDRLILRMHFCDGLKIVRIAAMLDTPQKPLYRRIYKILRQLEEVLAGLGATREDLVEFLSQGWPESDSEGSLFE